MYTKLKLIKNKNTTLRFDNNKFIYDLKSAIALWSEEDGIISFSHRSLQEYFAALFVKELNSEDNKRLYQKIINRFSAIKRLNEVENFISLLEEMDTLNFKKYYYLPLLEELNSLINSESDSKILENTLLFFSHGIGIQKTFIINEEGEKEQLEDVRHQIMIRDSVYKNIYIHIPHTRIFERELRQFLHKNRKKIDFNHPEVTVHDISRKGNKWIRNTHSIDFNEKVPEEFLKLLEGSKVQNRALLFNKFIVEEMVKTKDYIKNSLDIDKDLVDMI